MEKIYMQQQEKINYMKTRIVNFKYLLKEEEELSKKFMRMNEMCVGGGESFINSNFNNSESNIDKGEIGNCEDF